MSDIGSRETNYEIIRVSQVRKNGGQDQVDFTGVVAEGVRFWINFEEDTNKIFWQLDWSEK